MAIEDLKLPSSFTATLQPGVHTLILEIDPGNQELESNEENNVFEKKFTIVDKTITGTPGNDTLTGTANDDNIDGLGDNVSEFRNLLGSTGVTIYDGDDADDNVTNTELDFKRVDMLALGEAILDMAGGVYLGAGQIVEDIKFSNIALASTGLAPIGIDAFGIQWLHPSYPN